MAFLTLMFALLWQQPDFEHLYRQAYEQRLRKLGADHAKTAESARDLALYLAGRGDFDGAAPYIQQALEKSRSAQEATVLHNWAVGVEEQSPETAEKLYRRAMGIREIELTPLDPDLATTRLNLAGLLLRRGEAGAESLARNALAAFEKKLGPMSALTGDACGTLGAALATKGDVAGAERLFRRALAVAEKAHGAGSPQAANALDNLADLLEQTGRESAAGPLRNRAQRIRSRSR